MKKRILTTAALISLMALSASAAPNFSSIANEWLTELKKLFPIIVAIAFLVTVFVNLGDIRGENKNYSAFFIKIGIFAGAVAFVVVVFQQITDIKL